MDNMDIEKNLETGKELETSNNIMEETAKVIEGEPENNTEVIEETKAELEENTEVIEEHRVELVEDDETVKEAEVEQTTEVILEKEPEATKEAEVKLESKPEVKKEEKVVIKKDTKSKKEKAQVNIPAKNKVTVLDKLKGFGAKKLIAAGLLVVTIASASLVGYNMYSKKSGNIPLDSTQTVKGSEQKKAVTEITDMLGAIRKGNGYFNVVDGKDDAGKNTTETYIFNSHGEAIAQGSKYNYLTVFRKDGTSVRYTDIIDVGPDVELLKLMENAVGLLGSKDAKMEKPLKAIEGETDMDVYYVYINGWDNIRKLYSSINEKFADTMIENMKKSVPAGNNIDLRFKFVVGKDKQFSAGCELIMDKKEYTLWYFDGYLLLNDWKLSDDWYSYDFKDGKKADEMLNVLLKNLDTMFKKYADDNKLPAKGSNTTTPATGTDTTKAPATGTDTTKAPATGTDTTKTPVTTPSK